MDIKTFVDKYDSGGGWGCSCSDCGWNKAGNRWIYPSEVEHAVGEDGYDELTADYRSLDAELSKQAVAGYFAGGLAYEVGKRLDPNYVFFREKFDNGEGDGADSEDDTYTLSEVNAKGGINTFKKEIAKLDPDLRIFISGCMTDDVFALMNAGKEETLWATFDNGDGSGVKDGVIDGSEIGTVEGTWGTFLEYLKDLHKERPDRAEAVLYKLRGAPPERILAEIKALFPKYTDRYDLKQFPLMGGNVYPYVREGLEVIRKFTGRDVDVVSSATVPRPRWALAVSGREQFYMDLANYLARMPAGYKMDVEELARYVASNINNPPRATLSALVQGLAENPGRYLGVSYPMKLSTNFDIAGDSYEDESKMVNVSARNKGMIDELKGMRLKYKKGDSYYTFYIPIVRIEYGSLACDAGSPVSLATCMPMGFEMSFPEYKVSEFAHDEFRGAIDFDNKIVKNRFSENGLAGIMGGNSGLTVKAVKTIIRLDPRGLSIFMASIPSYSLELMLGEASKEALIDSEVVYRDEYKYQPPKPQDPPWPQDPEDPGPGDESAVPGKDPSL